MSWFSHYLLNKQRSKKLIFGCYFNPNYAMKFLVLRNGYSNIIKFNINYTIDRLLPEAESFYAKCWGYEDITVNQLELIHFLASIHMNLIFQFC